MKRFCLILLVATPCLFSTHSAFAVDCANADTTSDMIECADKDYRIADQALNRAYGAFKKTVDAAGNELLLNAQRAWLKFRDANCNLAADQARGGTMAPLLQIGCMTGMTKDRTKELNELVKGLGQ